MGWSCKPRICRHQPDIAWVLAYIPRLLAHFAGLQPHKPGVCWYLAYEPCIYSNQSDVLAYLARAVVLTNVTFILPNFAGILSHVAEVLTNFSRDGLLTHLANLLSNVATILANFPQGDFTAVLTHFSNVLANEPSIQQPDLTGLFTYKPGIRIR